MPDWNAYQALLIDVTQGAVEQEQALAVVQERRDQLVAEAREARNSQVAKVDAISAELGVLQERLKVLSRELAVAPQVPVPGPVSLPDVEHGVGEMSRWATAAEAGLESLRRSQARLATIAPAPSVPPPLPSLTAEKPQNRKTWLVLLGATVFLLIAAAVYFLI